MNRKRAYLSLAFAALLLCGARRPSPIHNVNAKDAELLIRDVGVTLIDVRSAKEYSNGCIPGAKSIPLAELSSRLKELPKDKTEPLLMYDRNGEKSARAARLLYESGRKDIYNLTGGIAAWAAAQKPIQLPQK